MDNLGCNVCMREASQILGCYVPGCALNVKEREEQQIRAKQLEAAELSVELLRSRIENRP